MMDMRIRRCLGEIIAMAPAALDDLNRGDPYDTLKPRLAAIARAAAVALEELSRSEVT